MQINSVNKQNSVGFKRMSTRENIFKLFRSPCNTKNIEKRFDQMRLILRQEGIHKLENVDIILDISTQGQSFEIEVSPKIFKRVRSSKERIFKNISGTDKCLSEIRKWADYWNKLYA